MLIALSVRQVIRLHSFVEKEKLNLISFPLANNLKLRVSNDNEKKGEAQIIQSIHTLFKSFFHKSPSVMEHLPTDYVRYSWRQL
jgi:hypothetical protein